MKLVFSTGNKGKLREAREILSPLGIEVVSPADAGLDAEVEETGLTFEENSLIKAEYLHSQGGCDCFADDSGMTVECLDGRPGIYSARYAGESKDFDDNIAKVAAEIREFEAVHGQCSRAASFVCVVTLILNGKAHYFEGSLDGHLILEKKGEGGFGYDPIFVPDAKYFAGSGSSEEVLAYPYAGLTASQISEEDKNAISHRGQALRKMAAWLASREK